MNKILKFIRGLGIIILFPVLGFLWFLGWVIIINSKEKEVVVRFE